MYLSIKCRDSYNFGANEIHAELFKPFRFQRGYYGDSLDVLFPQFPNHFLPFPMVFSCGLFLVETISAGKEFFTKKYFKVLYK